PGTIRTADVLSETHRRSRRTSVLGDQPDKTIRDSGRQVVAHAVDGDVPRPGDGRCGGAPAAGVHDAVAVAVDYQRGHRDSLHFRGAIAGLVDGVDRPCDAVAGRLPRPAVPGPRRVLGRTGLVGRETGARQVARQPEVFADEFLAGT